MFRSKELRKFHHRIPPAVQPIESWNVLNIPLSALSKMEDFGNNFQTTEHLWDVHSYILIMIMLF